jgi:hypothetical protein
VKTSSNFGQVSLASAIYPGKQKGLTQTAPSGPIPSIGLQQTSQFLDWVRPVGFDSQESQESSYLLARKARGCSSILASYFSYFLTIIDVFSIILCYTEIIAGGGVEGQMYFSYMLRL